MVHGMCEELWFKILLKEMGPFRGRSRMVLHCDNNASLHIVSNLFYLEWTKHIEVDCYLICEKVVAKKIHLEHAPTEDQLEDFLSTPAQSYSYHLLYPSLRRSVGNH